MKKLILSLSLLFAFFTPVNINALEPEVSSTIEYLSDGSYYETVIEAIPNTTRASTKSGSKTSTYYSEDHVAVWYVKVAGTFSYSGSSSVCTSSSVSAKSYSSNWIISSKSSSKTSNIAQAKATAKYYYNNNLAQTRTRTVELKCSSSGVLS